MSLTIPPPGTASRVLRHLRHMDPLPKNAKGGKFANKGPSYAAHTPKFVQPKDRIAYWNIGPGDEVKVTVGGTKVVDEVTGQKKRIPYEGIVATIDRERNLVWLRAGEDAKDDSRIPKNLKHVGSRLKDPDKGIEGGSTPNTAYQIRPVHYSNLQLKLPADLKLPKDVASELDLKKGVYASRIERTKVSYNTRVGHFMWRRYAVVPSADGALKIEVPWKVLEQRNKDRSSNASSMSAVDDETWIPWDPQNPVKLIPQHLRTSTQAEERLQEALKKREMSLERFQSASSAGGDIVQSKYGIYEGFTKKRAPMPLLPQPPTASEQVAHTRKEIAQWLLQAKEKGKSADQVFSAMDYIDITPIEGPNDSRWNSMPFAKQGAGADAEQSSSSLLSKNTGSKGLTRGQMDSWPIELLMANDLTNPKGLRNRMRSWHLKQADKQLSQEAARMEDARRVEVLRRKIGLDQAAKREAAVKAEILNAEKVIVETSAPSL